MERVFDNLVELLEDQKKIYEELLGLGKLKQTELVKGSIEVLESLNKREEMLIFQIGRLEEDRFQCTNDIIKMYGLEENTSLRELVKAAPVEIQEQLDEIQKAMTELLIQMEKINSENIELIKQSLRFIQFSLDTITQETQTTYTADRAMKVENLTRLLDKKV
jgi:flagellar biosynthesis/type III secretory pathway chaperone